MQRKIAEVIATSTLFFLVGMVFVKLFNLVYRVVVSRYFGAEGYGVFSLAIAVFSALSVFAVMGVNYFLNTTVPLYRARKDRVRMKSVIVSGLAFTLGTSCVIAVLMFWYAPLIAQQLHSSELVLLLRVLACALPFYTLLLNVQKIMEGFKLVKYSALVEMVAGALRLVLLFVFLFVGKSLFWVSASYAVAVIGAAVVAFIIMEKRVVALWNKVKTVFMFREMVQYSWPLLVSNMIVPLMSWTDTLFLGYFKSPYEVGMYSAALQIAGILAVLLAAFNTILLPLMAEMFAKKDKKQMDFIYKIATRWMLLATLPFVLFMVFLPENLLRVSFGREFAAAATALMILSVGFFASAFIGLSNGVLYSIARTRTVMMNTVLTFGLSIVLNFILIPRFGFLGAAMATTITMVCVNAVRLVQVYTFVQIQPFTRKLWNIVIAGVLAIAGAKGVFMWVDNKFVMWIGGALVFGIIYAAFLWVWGFEEADKVLFADIRKKARKFF